MATSNQFFKCRHCADGRVKKTIKSTNSSLDIKVGHCNKCKASYGMKSLEGLEKITTTP